MTIHATMNPVGSTNPKDLIDNAQNLDWLILGPLLSYPDRRGVNRLSWAGIEAAFAAAQAARAAEYSADKLARDTEFAEDQSSRSDAFEVDQDYREDQFNAFMAASGLEAPVAYASGILLDRTTKTVTYLGNEYRARSSFIPFTTSNWATDEAKLLLVGDDSLRQSLATPFVAGKGSDMVPFWQDHANAVSRPMRHKMRDIKSVLDYKGSGFPPIDPTGVIDSTAGLNAAHIAAKATNSELLYVDGIYKITDTIKACSHARFSQGARILHYGFTADKVAYEIQGDMPDTSQMHVHVQCGEGVLGDPSTYKGRGIVVSSREGNVNIYGAYNTTLFNPRVRYCNYGAILRSFQQAVYSPNISECKTGMAIAGTSGFNESGVINVYGGWIRDCPDYAAYIGDPRLLPVTTNNINGVTINFHGTQFIGTVRATKVAQLTFDKVNFEDFANAYGNRTALQLDADCYNVFADDCYFGRYDYAIKCAAQVFGILSVKRPIVYGIRKCIAYVFRMQSMVDVDSPTYIGGTNHDKAPAFHFGMPQADAATVAALFKNLAWKSSGFTIDSGVQSGTSTVEVALVGARRRETDGDYINIGAGGATGSGFYKTAPNVNVAGTLSVGGTAAYKFTLSDPAQARFFGAGDVVSCSVGAEGASNNIVTNVDYEVGIVSLSTSYSPTPLAGVLSQIAPTWVKRRNTGNFTATNAATYTVNDANTTAGSIILLMPRNAPAAQLMGGVKSLYVSSRVAGVSFTVSTADGSTMGALAPNFSYEMSNA